MTSTSDLGASPPTGSTIRTFLIADVRGYTVFTAEHGDEAAAELAARFARLAREGVEAREGRVVELRGDEALAVFDSARQAIRAAVELQRRFVEETIADPAIPLAVGIGLDAGEAVPVGDGFRGGALNLAARLCSLAGPAEVLASREVVHLARKVDGVAYVDRGPVRLKGLAEPVQVMRVHPEADDPADDLAFRRALGPTAGRPAPGAQGTLVANPYKGLRAFEEADAADFFGREALIEQLVERMTETRFLAVVGPSGSGKSSVVRAGLIPALRRGALDGSSTWPIAEMYPGPQPLEELEAALLRVATNPPSSLLEQLGSDERGLLRAAKRVLPADGSELVLLIDQFEEVFTLVQDESKRAHFLESIRTAATDPRSPVRIVITLRADFYDRPLLYRGFGDLLRTRIEALIPLSGDEFERAIAGPAKRVDVRLEEGLVAEMLSDVADEPGALPLLQYALTELFERREGGVLTREVYRSLGGVSGALGRRAEELYGALDDGGKEAARQLFLRLVALGEGTEDTRRPVARSELDSLDIDERAMAAVIEAFGTSRLLSFDRDARTGAPVVELAHEALLTAWGRLRRWIDEARDDLRTERRLALAAREWNEAERDQSFLAAGSRLEQFDAWQHSSEISTTPLELEFLQASLAERDRLRSEDEAREARERALERRSVTRLRALVAALTAGVLIAGGVTVFALNQSERAEREGRIAAARELAAASVASLSEDAERSILLALEAVAHTRSVDGTVLPEAEQALHRAVTASRIVLTVPGVGGSLDWSPDGTIFVTEGPEESGVIDIRDTETGTSVLTFPGHEVDVNEVAFSADGSMLATTGDDGALRVWDPQTGQELATVGGSEVVLGPSFSPDGTKVAAAWLFEGTVRVLDLDTDAMQEITTPAIEGPFGTSFSPDGERLVIAGFGRVPAAVVVDLETGEELLILDGHTDGVTDAVWSPDGRWIATSSFDSTARIWDGQTGELRFGLLGHAGGVVEVDWSPDSTRLLTGSEDGTAKVWEISDVGGQELLSLSGVGTGIWGATFSPDGSHVMTGDAAITATQIWDVSETGDAEWANLHADGGAVAFTPDGHLVARTDGSLDVRDASTREVMTSFGPFEAPEVPPPGEVIAMEVSPDGELLAVVGLDRLEVRDRTGATVFTIEGLIDDVSWSPDGAHLAVTDFEGGGAKILDRSGATVAELREEEGLGPLDLEFSPDGRLLATANIPIGRPDPSAMQITIWDWERGEVVTEIGTGAEAVAFDPGRDRIAVAKAGEVEIWSVSEGERLATLVGGTGLFLDVAFSPDGSHVAAAGVDGTVRIWNAEDFVQTLALRGDGDIVYDVAFSPDGTRLVSGGGEGQVRVWALELDDLIGIAEGELTRGLTEEECRQYLHGPCEGD